MLRRKYNRLISLHAGLTSEEINDLDMLISKVSYTEKEFWITVHEENVMSANKRVYWEINF